MAVEALLDALERRARDDITARLEAARAEARRMVERATAEVERRRRLHLERIEAGRRHAIARRFADQVRALRADVLVARAGLLEAVFAGAVDRLRTLPLTSYAARLKRLVPVMLGYLEDRQVEIRCPPDAAALVEQLASAWPMAKVVPDPAAAAGLVATTPERDLEVDGTLEALLTRWRADLAIELLAKVEGRDAVG